MTKNKKNIEDYLLREENVFLMKDGMNYKDDVTVTHNGINYQIQRGKNVAVPLFLKLVLEQSFAQQLVAADYCDELSRSFEKKHQELS